jgi:hypothetical protein
MQLLAGVQYLDGLTGATPDGDVWRITDGQTVVTAPGERA